jgi:hypothetical protein
MASEGDPGSKSANALAAAEPATGAQSIAIVGIGCRFPDADDPATLLDLVLTGRRAFRRLPPPRLELADYYSADRATPDATYSARAALLEGWQFDLAAFGVPAGVYPRTGWHWRPRRARSPRPDSPRARACPGAARGSSSATP